MNLNPVQQSAFAYDPARQLVTPPAPVQPAPPQVPQQAPIEASHTFQDKANTGKGGSRGTNGDQGSAQQEQVAQQLQDALSQLEQLRAQANDALAIGDTLSAKNAAQSAAEVATSIQDLAGAAPNTSVAENAVQQSADANTIPGDNGTVITLARTGVNTASDVVDTAAAISTHSDENRLAIAGYKRQVLDAMDAVEQAAGFPQSPPLTTMVYGAPKGVDISA